MIDRIVKRVITGELFIETSTQLWQHRMEAWQGNHDLACPLPIGHKIFSNPQDYQSVRVVQI